MPPTLMALPGTVDAIVTGDLERLPELARRHGILLVVLFGSTAKGRRRAASDLDVGVLFQGPPEDESWLTEEAALEGELEGVLRPVCPLDLVTLNRASEVLRKEVADCGIVLYADDPHRWVLYRIHAYRRYEDTEKYRRRRLAQLREKYGIAADEGTPE